jgi:hypothetical protein
MDCSAMSNDLPGGPISRSRRFWISPRLRHALCQLLRTASINAIGPKSGHLKAARGFFRALPSRGVLRFIDKKQTISIGLEG